MNRTQLEDAVWELPAIQSSGIEFDELELLTDSQLLAMLAATDPENEKPVKLVAPVNTVERWRKVSDVLQLVDGALCSVETWTSSHGRSKQHIVKCGPRVTFEGRVCTTRLVEHYLKTGQWVKRVPKPVRHRAVARIGGKVTHLGYFDTTEERDAALSAAKSMA